MPVLKTSEKGLSNWIVVRAVEELIKLHAPENWAASFVAELDQSKEHKCFDVGDVGATAQYLCKSARGIFRGIGKASQS